MIEVGQVQDHGLGPQKIKLLPGQLKHEIRRESVPVPFDGLDQGPRLDGVELGQMGRSGESPAAPKTYYFRNV